MTEPNATFSLILPPTAIIRRPQWVGEDEMRAAWAELAPTLLNGLGNPDWPFGQLTVKAGEQAVALHDALTPTILSACLEPIPALLAGRPAEVYAFTYAGGWRYRPAGDGLIAIETIGPLPDLGRFAPAGYGDRLIVAARPLAQTLHACAARYGRFLSLLADARPDHLGLRADAAQLADLITAQAADLVA